MAKASSFRTAWEPRLLSLVRLVAGLLFMEHGTAKLFGFPAGGHHVALFSLLGLAGVLETFGGLLVAVGLFTRPAAFILSGEMAVAYFKVHFPHSFFPLLNGGDAAVLYCFLFLYISLTGGGSWKLDQLRRR
ncbi:MAG TPA: DoxX family protein [Acetobacteraceae bacterium]|nr:DoxX family protein [Acetobacteraceae bacterium]